jgi:hypothetical protein
MLIAGLLGRCLVEPAIGVDPVHGLAGGEVEDMGAAAEPVEPRPRAGVGVLEAPSSGEAELGGAALHELDEALGIAGHVVAHPELAAAMLRLDREEEAFGGRFLRCAVLGQRL